MADSKIVITASLKVPETVETIKKDLKTVEGMLESNPLQLFCTISDSSIKQMQSQLDSLTKGLTINANVNAQNIQQSINQAVKSEPVKVSVEADIKKGELQKQVNAFVEKFHLTFDTGKSGDLKAELSEILAKYDQMKKAGNALGMEKQWDELTNFVEQYATEIDTVSEKLREAAKQSKLFISETQKSDLLAAFGSKGAVRDYLNSTIGWFKWTYNRNNGGTSWDDYSTQLNNLIQTGLYDVNANSIDDVAKINTTHIVEGLAQLNDLLHQDTRLADEWYKTYENDLEALRGMWEGLRQGVVDYLNEIRGEKQTLADMGWEDITPSESTEKVRNYTEVLKEGLEKIASLKAQIYSEGGDAIKSVTSRFTADATGNVDGFVLAIQKSNGEVENLYHKLVEVEDETGNITREWARTQITGSDSGIQKAIEQASKSADTLERRLINLKAAADDKSAPRPIKSEESIGKVEAAYNKAIEAIEKLRQADKSTFAELDNEAKKAVDDFNNVVKAMRNADTAATKLRAKPIETIKAEETANLDKFVATISNSAIPNIENLTKRVDELRNELNTLKTGDKQGLTNYLDNFSILEEQFKTLNTQAKITKSVLNDLGKMPQNSDIKALTSEYQALMSQIGTAKTVDDYRAISETLATLKPLFNEIIQKTNDETIAAEKTANAIKAISDAYDKITSLNKQLTTGNLTSVEANYKKEEINALEVLAIEERLSLQYAGLYTEEVQKQIKAIKNKSNAIIESRNQQKANDEQLAEAEKKHEAALTIIRNAYKEIASAQKTLSSGKATDVDVSYALAAQIEQRALVESTRERLELEGLLDAEILDEIKNGEILVIKTRQIAEADRDAAQAKKDEIEAEKAYKKELQDVNKIIKDNLTALEKFNNSTVAKNNKSNADVIGQVGTNNNLITQLKAWQDSLNVDSSATNVAKIKAEIDALSGSLKNAVTDSQNLNNSLANSNAEATLEAKIKNLTNQVSIFANTNRKATESLRTMRDGQTTFADEWQRIKTALSSGTLDDAALKRLAQDFRNFKGEADSAGLTVNRFFQSMQSQLRMVLQRWISLYAVIGYIRKMIDAVKELDTAMINLKRVTDETDTGYERFLNDANELARTMKTTTSSLVEQAYQWSKLGFSINEALELAQASTVFMKVADVGQDQALSNLVTTLKAFRIEADQTMDVVDKLDKLNNRYAVSASGLGQGLERAASTMAMSGNTLEETLAMLTGAGEITQSLEETGNGIKILSLRLRGMKGALEELNEPVDDLMEVSKVQTQILNLTHNQVNIFDEATQEFRSTYDIMKDISDIWDSLSSTSRSNLTEILFGKQRSNIGLALIQAFQSGQVQNAFEDATDAAGTATEEYEKMMNGVQAQFDALKGAAQEFANAFIKSDFVKGFAKFGTWLMSALTTITNKTNALVVVATPLLAFLGGKYKTNIFTLLINGIKGLVSAETGAITATGALTTALEVFKGALSGLAVGALIAAISWAIDELVVSESEMQESIDEITDSVSGLADATNDLKDAQSDIENTIASYSKIATTVADVNERKTQLLELQNNLQDTYKGEADGIDLVNGKYSEQIKKMKELAEEQRRQYEIENADKIARARRLASLNVTDISAVETNNGTKYTRTNWKDNERSLYTLNKMDEKVIQIAKNINGVYESASGARGGVKGFYLSGTLEDARNQLKQIIDNYSKLRDVDSETLEKLTARYKELNDALNDIKEVTPYIEDIEFKPFFTGAFDGLADAVNQAVSDVTMQPFYDKLDEAQDKLKQLANPSDLTIAEYDTLYRDVQNLEHELYKLAGDSEESRQAVADLFNGFKQGISENGDHLEQFVEQFNTTLEESFKSVAETVTNVQDALNNLAEGKGLSHNDAWKLLKEDTEGYLRSIKLVNGEYYFSQEELIKFKDAKIKASVEDLKASNEQYKQERENLLKQLNLLNENLKTQLEIYNLKVMQRLATSSDLEEIEKIKINISETETSIKRCEDLWTRNNYLIEELNQNLGDTRVISAAIETELNNTIKGFEDEIDAIEDTIDNLNDRKDILESEKSDLQDQLELLKEQKKALEDQQKTLKDAVEKYMKRYEESLQAQLDAIKQQKDDVKDAYDERIKALKTENEERDLAYKKEKALLDLNKAKEQQVRTYSSARGWEYGASKEEITKAQKDLDDVLADEQIQALEKERDEKVSALEKQEKEYDKRIKAYQEYARKYEETTEIIENADGELLAEQLLGADWRDEIEKQDEELLASYKREYSKFADEIDRLTKNEIADIEASIKAKESEIDEIEEEIKAYNKYKSSVKDNLDGAKEALEDYKTAVESAKTDVTNAMNDMAGVVDETENRIWDKSNRIKQWFWEVGESAKELKETLTNHLLSGDIDLSTYVRMMKASGMGSFANGGQIDYTGLAMVHGSKSNPEVVFNAADSKKLYDMVHNTPNLIASVAKQASQINPTNVKNSTNTNSINVNIGQVVANNPQELTRNLDTHLDSYFRRKLTQGYAQ